MTHRISNVTMRLGMLIRGHPLVCSSMTASLCALQTPLLYAPVWLSGMLLPSCDQYTTLQNQLLQFFFCGWFHLYRCGYDQQVGSSSEVAPTDGVLGLGSGSISLLSQLSQHGITKNVVGHCLSLRGGGFLFFGDDLVPYSRATWTPMARSAFR